jgi:hypothetical protein
MTHPGPHELGVTAWLVVVCFALLVIAGSVWHGVTEENFLRIWQNLVDRPSRQMSFRFALQPVVASFFAIRHGLADARNGRSPYLWTILWNPQERVARLREGLNATARILLIALVIDAVYQVLELRTFYPAEAPIVALLLAFLPYVLVRGMTARAARWRSGQAMATPTANRELP